MQNGLNPFDKNALNANYNFLERNKLYFDSK